MKHPRRTALFALAALAVTSSANATLVFVTSETLFSALTTNRATDTFSDVIAGTSYGPPIQRSVGPGQTYSLSANNARSYIGQAGSVAPSGGNYLANTSPSNIFNFSNSVTAIGGYFSGSSDGSGTIRLDAVDLDGSMLTGTIVCANTRATCFAGFLTTDGFSFVDYRALNNNTVGLDDLTFASYAPTAAVPEPTTVSLMFVGIAGLWVSRRRLSMKASAQVA